MNIMIAAVGIDPGFGASAGGAFGAACATVLAGAGVVLLAAAGRLARRGLPQDPVRYTAPRL